MNLVAIANNFFLISNYLVKNGNCLRIEKLKDGSEILKKNGLIRRYLFYPFYNRHAHFQAIERFINIQVIHLSFMERDQLIDANKITRVFEAAQKYNQTLQHLKTYSRDRLPSSALIRQISLNFIHNAAVSELNPSVVEAVKDASSQQLLDESDQPEVVQERRFFKTHSVYRYPGDDADHSKEATQIFISTQLERLLSGFGYVVEAVARLFGFKVLSFQKYHYRNQHETDEQIYAAPTSPFSPNEHPSSYWLGHASLFLSIPLKSKEGTVASFHMITDPVEKDLNPIFYPRQTKIARPIEGMPAPDLYLLSHNHFDHYDESAVKRIFAQQPIMIVPKGDGSRYKHIARQLGLSGENIHELNWWETREIKFQKNGHSYSLRITATPAHHWSGQGPCGGHESTFLGYVIQGHEEGDIYFAGDTARLNETHIKKLTEHFNIRWNFQPGGPDEIRKEMESTHQASVDGLWMHFKMMIPRIYKKGMSKAAFLAKAQDLRTIYMHTMTFKLGNLHLSDTKNSLNRVLEALSSQENDQILKRYEQRVYDELCALANDLDFENGEKLLPSEVASLLKETVIIPKIGSNLDLVTAKDHQMESYYF